jgi:hypothetical protein
MPDANGLPLPAECLQKLDLVLPVAGSAGLLKELKPVLASVIAELQSPVGENGKGGTGRRFVPITETRIYDGSGHSSLLVDDMVPGSALSVTAFSLPLLNVIISNDFDGLGHNTIVRPTYIGAGAPYPVFYTGRAYVFPRGVQNIAVTTTWGFAATAPADVYEAVRCETCYRMLVTGAVSINGVGEDVKIEGFEISTAVGAINWRISSPIGVFHDNWLNMLNRYRLKPHYVGGRAMKRMY